MEDKNNTVAALASEVPALVGDAGSSAKLACEEFFYGKLRNGSTRKNYQHAVRRFLAFCEQRQRKIVSIIPRDVGEYLDSIPYSTATAKLHLAGLRHFFDVMVSRRSRLILRKEILPWIASAPQASNSNIATEF